MEGVTEPPRLSLPEYEALTPYSASVVLARRNFYGAVRQYAAKALTELADEPLKYHEELRDATMEVGGGKLRYIPKEWYEALYNWLYLDNVVCSGEEYLLDRTANRRRPRWQLELLNDILPVYTQLQASLEAWSDRWQLNAANVIHGFNFIGLKGLDWIMAHALYALFRCSALYEDIGEAWDEAATFPDPPFEVLPHVSAKRFRPPAITGWSPTTQRRADFVRDARAAFEHALTEYVSDQENQANLQNIPPARRTLTADHSVWLVYYQMHRRSYQWIADNVAHRDRKTVEEAVKANAQWIGLQVRAPSAGGRPRKRLPAN